MSWMLVVWILGFFLCARTAFVYMFDGYRYKGQREVGCVYCCNQKRRHLKEGCNCGECRHLTDDFKSVALVSLGTGLLWPLMVPGWLIVQSIQWLVFRETKEEKKVRANRRRLAEELESKRLAKDYNLPEAEE